MVPSALFDADEPAPGTLHNAAGTSPFVLLGDHAGNAVPRALKELGLPRAELLRHIGWDIGVRALGMALSRLLDAPFVHQHYSRLVADCNRAPGALACVPETSDGTPIPGNAGLSAEARQARIAGVHTPYHNAVNAVLEARAGVRESIVISLHSFTPRLMTSAHAGTRPWQFGVLHHGGDTRFALGCLAALRSEPALCVGDNEPYRMDETDFTVPFHCTMRDLPYLELEVRQDLLGTEEDIAQAADLLSRMCHHARARMQA
jgi:predicted N-formylglutamate amidohydrolase